MKKKKSIEQIIEHLASVVPVGQVRSFTLTSLQAFANRKCKPMFVQDLLDEVEFDTPYHLYEDAGHPLDGRRFVFVNQEGLIPVAWEPPADCSTGLCSMATIRLDVLQVSSGNTDGETSGSKPTAVEEATSEEVDGTDISDTTTSAKLDGDPEEQPGNGLKQLKSKK